MPAGRCLGVTALVFLASGCNGGSVVLPTEAPPYEILSWGSEGSLNAQFTSPAAIAIGPRQEIYVIDGGGNARMRVQVFSPTGAFLHKWYLPDSSGSIYYPSPNDLDVDESGQTYVVTQRKVRKFDPRGLDLGTLGGPDSAAGQLVAPMAVAAGIGGVVHVLDEACSCVKKFSPDAKFIGALGFQAGRELTGRIAVDPEGAIYVAAEYWILRLAVDGATLATIRSRGRIVGITVPNRRGIFVAYQDGPDKFDADGSTVWAENYFWQDFFRRGYAHDVVADESGHFYLLTDRKVIKFGVAL